MELFICGSRLPPVPTSTQFTSGAIQVCYNLLWGNICDQPWFGFGKSEADVVCHQLGYTGASKYSSNRYTVLLCVFVYICVYAVSVYVFLLYVLHLLLLWILSNVCFKNFMSFSSCKRESCKPWINGFKLLVWINDAAMHLVPKLIQNCMPRPLYVPKTKMAVQKSCEPRRCSTYSDDLRWRMVYQCEALNLTYDTVAANLNVGPSTMCRTIQLSSRTGHVTKKQYDSSNLPCKSDWHYTCISSSFCFKYCYRAAWDTAVWNSIGNWADSWHAHT